MSRCYNLYTACCFRIRAGRPYISTRRNTSLLVPASELNSIVRDQHSAGSSAVSCWPGRKAGSWLVAARLSLLGHEPEFGGFLYPSKPVWLTLNEKTVEPFPLRVEFFFKLLAGNGSKCAETAGSHCQNAAIFSAAGTHP